jgi:hypothetical protein
MRLTPRVAGFRSEYPAGFKLECMAGFVGTRIPCDNAQRTEPWRRRRAAPPSPQPDVRERRVLRQSFDRCLSRAIFLTPVAAGESTAAGGTLMDHPRLPHQPAARNKLICGWTSVRVPGHAVGQQGQAEHRPIRYGLPPSHFRYIGYRRMTALRQKQKSPGVRFSFLHNLDPQQTFDLVVV